MPSSQPSIRRRVRRSQSEWSALIAEQAASGQNRKAFCAERGIALASFGAAKRRGIVVAAPVSRATDDFVPVSLAALSDADADDERHRSSAHDWRIELSLPDGITVRVIRG